MNRKERREQARRGGNGPTGPGSVPPGAEGIRMRMGADRDEVLRGAQVIPGALLMQPEGGGPTDTPPSPIPVMVVGSATLRQTPGLQRLFDLQRARGTEWLGGQIDGQVNWSMMSEFGGEKTTPTVILRLRLHAPHVVNGDFLLDLAQLAAVLRPAVDSPFLGLMMETQLADWQINPPNNFAEGMERVVLIRKQPSMVLRQALMLYDNGRS